MRSDAPSHLADACHPEQLEGLNRNSSCRNLQPLLQNVWGEVEYRIDVCRATSERCFEFVQYMKENLFEFLCTAACVQVSCGCYFHTSKYVIASLCMIVRCIKQYVY